jgi:hypothetical protein
MKLEKDEVYNGEIELDGKVLKYSFIPARIAKDYFAVIKDITEAEKSLKTDQEINRYSALIAKLMYMIFGQEVSDKIIEWYGDDSQGMIEQIIYANCVEIMPTVRRCALERTKRLMKQNREIRNASRRKWKS